MSSIVKVAERAKLKSRREPYWAKLSKGAYLGYRKMTADSDGTWIARSFDEATRKQQYRSLGDFSTLPDHQRFDAASKAAREWFEHLGKGGSTKKITVAAACGRYAEHLRNAKRDAAAKAAEARFERHLLVDRTFAQMELSKLQPAHVEAWRTALREKPVPTGRTKGNARSASSLNRDMNTLRAALNLAYRDQLVTSNFAWKTKLAPVKNADKRRDIYLDLGQRRKVIAAATPDMANFLRALSLIPLRPGALAVLTAGQFDARLGVLTIGLDKAGSHRKISLPPETSRFYALHCKNKKSAELIFTNSQRPWTRDTWGYHFGEAAKRAGLPPNATTYTIRHSTITDMIHAGVDSLTVAQLAGTSVAMIEKHYGHLTEDHARSALKALVL